MDDMALAWFTDDYRVQPVAMRPETPPPPSVDYMVELIARVRQEQADNARKVTFMCHPEDRDRVDEQLRKAAAQLAREEGLRSVRRWKLVASSHIPRGQVISWLDHLNTAGKAVRGAQAFPPLGIMAPPRTAIMAPPRKAVR